MLKQHSAYHDKYAFWDIKKVKPWFLLNIKVEKKVLQNPTVLLSGPVSFVWVLDTEADILAANRLFYKAQILTFKQNQT